MSKPNAKEKNEKECEKKAAREVVNLTHVDTQKQKVDRDSLANMLNVKKKIDEEKQIQKGLTNDEKNILGAFQKKRMDLDRIWIIVNQTRKSLGIDPIKRADIKILLDGLVKSEYLTYEEVEYDRKINEIYILTEKGQEETI